MFNASVNGAFQHFSVCPISYQTYFVHLIGESKLIKLLLLTFLLTSSWSYAASSMSVDEYRIGPEDVLHISVWKEEGLEREVIVRPDGGISFPFAGEVKAAGRTPAQLQAIITERIQQYIPDALVTVAITKLTGLRIYVIGKVKKSGQFVVGRYVDVLQALTLAGGLDPYASEKKIKVLRRVKGKEIVLPFNYAAIKDGENLTQNIILQNDDVVVVP